MYLEERYSKMTDSEVLERYKDFDSCFYVAQIIILKEMEKRKLISEEKIKIHYQEINDKKEKEKSENIAKEKKSSKKSSFKTLFLIFIIGGVIRVFLPVAISNMGNSAYLKGDYAKAEKLCRISEMINDGYPANLTMLGMILVAEEKYGEALRPLLKAKNIYDKRNEKNDFVLEYLSLAYLNLKDYDKFDKLFPEAIKYTKNSEMKAHYYRNIAIHYMGINDSEKGLAYINEAIKTNPKEAGFYFLRGCNYLELKNYKEALKNFLVQVEKQNKITNDVYYRIFVCYRLGEINLKKSLEYLDLHIENYENIPRHDLQPIYYFYRIKSELLRDMGDIKGAKEYADKVINFDKSKIKDKKDYDEDVLEIKKILESIKEKK